MARSGQTHICLRKVLKEHNTFALQSAPDIVLLWLVTGHTGMAALELKAGCGQRLCRLTSNCDQPAKKSQEGDMRTSSKDRTACSAI